jgi:DNA-directed RNA polymerase subunit RPC12/RpoP
MGRFYDCTNCMKTFKFSSVTEPSAEIPETKVSVTCPVCSTPNTATLPQGAKFIVTPAKLAYRPLFDFRTSGSFAGFISYD